MQSTIVTYHKNAEVGKMVAFALHAVKNAIFGSVVGQSASFWWPAISVKVPKDTYGIRTILKTMTEKVRGNQVNIEILWMIVLESTDDRKFSHYTILSFVTVPPFDTQSWVWHPHFELSRLRKSHICSASPRFATISLVSDFEGH